MRKQLWAMLSALAPVKSPVQGASADGRKRRARGIAAPLTSRCMAFVLTLALVGSSTQTAWAGCCDDFWGCAAAIATDGLSCVVEGLIDTVNNLVHKVSNLRNQINGMSNDAAHKAQQAVIDAADSLRGETQNALDQQNQAHNRAIQVVNDETAPGVLRSKTQPAGKTAANGASVGTANQPAGQNKVGNNATARNANVPAPASNSPRITGATGVMAPALRPADPAEIQEEEKQALKEVEKQQAASEARGNNINAMANKAKNQAANGVNVGLNLASKLAVAPLDGVANWLKDLLAHPDKIFDPTSIIDSEVDTVMNDLSSTLDQVANAVTSDANRTMQSAQSDYDEVQLEKAREELMAEKMEVLHRDRTQAALEDLYKLVPPPRMNHAAVQGVAASAGIGSARVPFNAILARISIGRQRAVAVPKQRIQEVQMQVAQLKAIRFQARNIRGSLPTYQRTFSQKMDGYLAGKSTADLDRRRDQLIAEARAHFAGDPRTRDAVIKLLTAEAGRRISRGRARVGG
jgi:hypothetical protein